MGTIQSPNDWTWAQPFLATAFATLDSKPCFFGGAATFGFFVAVGAGRVLALALGFRASALGGAAELRLPSVVVRFDWPPGTAGTVGVVGALRPNNDVVLGAFVVDDDCGTEVGLVVDVPVALVAKLPSLLPLELEPTGATVAAGANVVVVVVGPGAATSNPA